MSATDAAPRRRLPRPWRRRQIAAALLLAVASTAATLGWIAVTLSSYAWWGSPRSPLGALFWPGMIAFAVWALCRAGHWKLLCTCKKIEREGTR